MPDNDVKLLPHTPQHLRALLERPEAYEQLTGVEVASGVRDFLAGPEVSAEFLERLKEWDAANPWEDGFGIVHVPDNKVIGLCSFVGTPTEDGMVEIAYGIAPEYQGRGYATAAARAMIAYAAASGRVRIIRAHTLPQENASTRVLRKCGFAFIGEVIHAEDGAVWRWEKAEDLT